MLKKSGRVYLDENGKEFIKKIDDDRETIVYYPPSEEDYFN